jgi:hypothetical protein
MFIEQVVSICFISFVFAVRLLQRNKNKKPIRVMGFLALTVTLIRAITAGNRPVIYLALRLLS